MAIEEKVIQPDSVNPTLNSPWLKLLHNQLNHKHQILTSVKAEYEAKLAAARKEAAEAQEKFQRHQR